MLLNLLPVSLLAAVSLPSSTNEKHFQNSALEDKKFCGTI